MRKLIFFILISFSLLAQKNLYVNSAIGNDATTYANNSSSTPWATITRAAYGNSDRGSPNASEAADAGDTVFVSAGTYQTTGRNNRWLVAYNPVNNGTSGSPIVFKADGTVTLTYLSGVGPVIGAYSVDYIHWIGFTIDEANALSTPDTGPVVLSATIGSAIKECFLDGNGDPGYGDNHPGIRIEGGDSCLVSNNTIHSFTTSGVNSNNGNGIQFYESDYTVVEHNEIYSCGAGIFVKGPADVRSVSDTIRYNYIHDINVVGIILSGAENNIVYQNLVTDSYEGFRFWALTSNANPRGCKVVNNTFYNMANASFNIRVNTADMQNNLFYNNICYDAPWMYWSENTTTPVPATIDYNCFDTYATAFSLLYGTTRTKAQWESAFSLDANSLDTDPLFVNAAVDSFQLQATSPCTTGYDTLDLDGDSSTNDAINMGCYITGSESIGLGETSTPATPPASSVTLKMTFQED